MNLIETWKGASWWKRGRLVLVWLVALYMATMYIDMGWAKFDPDGFWTAPFERWGYPVWLRIVVGVIETVGGLMILVPWIASYGGVALSIIMFGAGITRLNDGHLVDVAWITLYLVVCLWIAYEWWGIRWPRFRLPAKEE